MTPPAFPDSDEVRRRVTRAAELKTQLVSFALTAPFQKPLRSLVRELEPLQMEPKSELIYACELLLFEHRYDDGSTVLDRFVAKARGLDAADVALVRGWADAVEGIFEVTWHGGDRLALTNLFDDLDYPAYATAGPEALADVEVGWFLATRLLPLGDHWILSGEQLPFAPDAREAVATMVAEGALAHPERVLRNPRYLEAARRSTRRHHEAFLALFGTDLLLVDPDDVAPTYVRLLRFHAERTASASRPEHLPEPGSLVDTEEYAEMFAGASKVGILHREDSGIWFLADYDVILEAHEQPDLVKARGRHREIVRGYLEDDSIPPFVFEDLHEQYGAASDVVLQRALDRPGFTWAEDGPTLMRRYKREQVDRPVPITAVPLPKIAQELHGVG